MNEEEISYADEVKELLFEKLEEKTGWGKNELKTLYQNVEIEVMRRRLMSRK